LAATTTSLMLLQTCSTFSSSIPMMAAMVEGSASQAFCMAWALAYTSLSASSKPSVLLATRAENSPRECPATMSGLKFSMVEARITECRKMAGWVTLVCFRSSSVPSNIISVMRKPRISLAFSNRSRALLCPSYNSFPIPTNWAPCPGNTNACISKF